MINRRQFCFSLANLSTLFALPVNPQALASDAPPEPLDLAVFPAAARATIESLEDFLRRHPTAFSWHIHNELRRLYQDFSQEHALHHANVILEHMPMDRYTLQSLSDWQLEKDPAYAIATLWAKVLRYPQFAFLVAACLLQIGELLGRDSGRAAPAQHVYRVVAAAQAPSPALNAGLRPYRQLAQYRLGFAAPARRFA